ncbi:unnamed protein product [Tuber aestivum]|uniref:Uncharacterized protein n=1 Tax=Tuber aestivum TaxID=59557 RepID=A0A292PXQ2_9PEZI|nr:unnamed protein product [Tuber aestivum]
MSEASRGAQESNAPAQRGGRRRARKSARARPTRRSSKVPAVPITNTEPTGEDPQASSAGVLHSAPDRENFQDPGSSSAAASNSVGPQPPLTYSVEEQEPVLYRPRNCPNVTIEVPVRAVVAPMEVRSEPDKQSKEESVFSIGGDQIPDSPRDYQKFAPLPGHEETDDDAEETGDHEGTEGGGGEEGPHEGIGQEVAAEVQHDPSSSAGPLGNWWGGEGEGEGEDILEVNPFEFLCDDPETYEIHLTPVFPESLSSPPNMTDPPLPEFRSEATEALDLILGLNPEPPYGVDIAQLFADALGTSPDSQPSPAGPPGVGSQLSATLGGNTVPPPPVNSATGATQPVALTIGHQGTPEAFLGSSVSDGLLPGPSTGGSIESQAAGELSQRYSATRPPSRRQTMSPNPWVVPRGDPIMTGLLMAGPYSAPRREQDFSGAFRPGSQNPTLYDPESDPYRDPPLTRVMGPLPPNSIWRRTFPVNTDAVQSPESGGFPSNSMGAPGPIDTGCPAPPQINPYSTYASYPPLPLPPREETLRPWANDISDYGVQFISLRDCDLGALAESVENEVISAFSQDWLAESDEGESMSGLSTGLAEGNDLNSPSVSLQMGDVSGPGSESDEDTPQHEAQEAGIESSGSSDQQPATKRQRINQQNQLPDHVLGTTSAKDGLDIDEHPSGGGKEIPDWVLDLMAADKEEEDIFAGETDYEMEEEGSLSPRRSQGGYSLMGKAVSSAESAEPAEPAGSAEFIKGGQAVATGTSTSAQPGEKAMTKVPKPGFSVGVGTDPPNFNRTDYKFYPDDPDSDTRSERPTFATPPINAAEYTYFPDSMEDEPQPQRRPRGRPRKIRATEQVVAPAQNPVENTLQDPLGNTAQNTVQDTLQNNMQTTITDAGPYQGRLVHLGWLVPYQKGEGICLVGCESLPGTIGCLRCFDLRFPGYRKRENMNPLMITRRLGPDECPTEGVQGAQEQSGLLAPTKGKEAIGLSIGMSTAPAQRRRPAQGKYQAVESQDGDEEQTQLGSSKASSRKRSLVTSAAKQSLPPAWEPRVTRSTAELSPLPAKRTASVSSNTLSTAGPTPGRGSATKSTDPKNRRSQARDARGKFVLSTGKAGDASTSTAKTQAKAKQTPKRAGTTGPQKYTAKGKAVLDSSEEEDRTPPFPGHWSHDNIGPVESECEDEPQSDADSAVEEGSEYDDGN